jgi:hypothetical protein
VDLFSDRGSNPRASTRKTIQRKNGASISEAPFFFFSSARVT